MTREKFIGLAGKNFVFPKNEGGRGFQELSKFNDSLMAKQVWRLKNHENSLPQGLQSKNFPRLLYYGM